MTYPSIMRLFMSLEEAATGVGAPEIEYVFYAKANLDWIVDEAQSTEDHEQWEIKVPKSEGNASAGRMRIRKTSWPGQRRMAEYALTIKTKLPDKGDFEVTTPSSPDAMAQFKTMSERGMVKRRYLLECPGRQSPWEIDVFFDETGQPHPWVKIDFELKGGETGCPPLPPHFEQAVQSTSPDPAAQAFIRNLYDTVFLKTNPPAA